MKNSFKIVLMVVICLAISGCFKRDDLEDVNIYTTVYPVEFITDQLYGENSQIYSIYPDEVDVNTYELTEKQINDYSKAAIFVYNGLTNEKQVARDFLNKNEDLQIIDVSYGLKYSNSVEELWLSPNNFLMLATNVKNNLQEFIKNKLIKEEIEDNFKVLEEKLSLLDAELRSVAASAKENDKNTIVVSDSVFKFLEGYGFNVIDLSDEETVLTNLKEKFENDDYKYIFVRDDQELNEDLKEFVNECDAELVTVDMMTVLDENQRKNNDNYLTIMNTFMENIKNAVLN